MVSYAIIIVLRIIIFHLCVIKTTSFSPFAVAVNRPSQQHFSTSGIVDQDISTIGNVVFVLPDNADEIESKFGSYSPVGNPSLLQAMQHVSKKVKWFSDATVSTEVILLPSNDLVKDLDEMKQKLIDSNALIVMNIQNENHIQFLADVFEHRRSAEIKSQCQFAIDCHNDLPTLVGSYDTKSPSILSVLPWTEDASGQRMIEQMQGLFDR